MLLLAAPNFAQRGGAVLAVSGRANANVSLAAVGDFVVGVWSAALPDGAADVFAAVSRDGGEIFGRPVRVNQMAGEPRVNGEQPPRVALSAPRGAGGTPEIAVVWTAKGKAGTTMVSAHSVDGGRTFSPSALVPGTDAPGNRGWEAVADAPEGRFMAVWLDHRQLAAPETTKTEAAHVHNHSETPPSGGGGSAIADADAMAAKSQLFVSSLDGTIAPKGLTGGVCYCCKTAIARRGDNMFLAWRHVYAGSLRDIAFAMSRDGGRTFGKPVRVSEDKWQINGCPDDGPAMSVEPGGRVHIVWPTVIAERGGQVKALFYASTNDGATFTVRQRIPTEGQANHPQLTALSDGSLIVAWDESGGVRKIAVARGRVTNGVPGFVRAPAPTAGPGSYPAVVATRAGALIAWTSGDVTSSVIATARIP